MLGICILVVLILGASLVYITLKHRHRANVNQPLKRHGKFHHVPDNLPREISYMDQLNGYQFEDYTAWLLKLNGFVGIKQTGKDHDYGLDVLAYRDRIPWGFQCKHYMNRKISRRTVKHTADGAHFYSTRRAVIITNTVFSRRAIQARKFFHVQLWDRSVLIGLIKHAIKNYHQIYRQ